MLLFSLHFARKESRHRSVMSRCGTRRRSMRQIPKAILAAVSSAIPLLRSGNGAKLLLRFRLRFQGLVAKSATSQCLLLACVAPGFSPPLESQRGGER
jgi:hypothetical protein